MPIPHSSVQPISRPARKPPDVRTIGLILTSVLLGAALWAQDPQQAEGPPLNIVKLVAKRESETQKERNEYTYRQTFTLDEVDDHGATRGIYREVRDIIFSPEHERTEKVIGSATNTLKNLI